MTLDHELRALLSTRADAVTPMADPFTGVERRARGLRRRRTAAAVAGSALAVLAVVGAGTLLSPGRSVPSGLATAAPSPSSSSSPSPSPSPSPLAAYALDAEHPWPYRGSLPRPTAPALTAAWTAAHPGTTSVTPLFGQTWEPSQQPEVVVLARGADGDRWGVLQGSGAGWTLAFDAPLDDPLGLVATLAGDESDRLLVVTAPGTRVQEYRPDGGTTPGSDLAVLADGVATGPLPRSLPHDAVRVGAEGGRLSFDLEVPERAASGEDASTAPANVLDWPTRGTVDPVVVTAARQVYAGGRPGTDPTEVAEKVLVAGTLGTRRYLLGQFWLPGDRDADTFAVVVDDLDDVEPQLYRPLPGNGTTDLVLMHLSPPAGSTVGALVVVGRPGLGALSYSPDATSPFEQQRTDGPGLVAVVQRPDSAERSGADRLRVVRPGRGARSVGVATLLCGKTSCG